MVSVLIIKRGRADLSEFLDIYPEVILAQIAIFLANIYFVRWFFVEPYKLLLKKREEMTTGSLSVGERLLIDYRKKKSIYDKKIEDAFLAGKTNR
jgi:F0F1-type ATP synthase membrane subunit b/b'